MKRTVFGLFGILACACIASAEPLGGRIQVIDGDTIWHYDCDVGRRCKPEKIRLLDIDAPESHRSACERELIAGLRAKARLLELVSLKPVSIIRCEEHGQECEDRFGRTLARIRLADGREAGAVLIGEGLALKYVPGRKKDRNAHWCGE